MILNTSKQHHILIQDQEKDLLIMLIPMTMNYQVLAKK